MDRGGQLDPAERRRRGAAVIHRLHVFHAFFRLEPVAHLERRDHRRAGALRDLDHIRHVIAVPVRNENEISRHLADIDFFRERIRRNEGIEEQRFAGDFDGETGVAVIGEFHTYR